VLPTVSLHDGSTGASPRFYVPLRPKPQHAFSDRFVAYMLTRNIRIEQDLIDQLFNSIEKRLARTLLPLARYGQEAQPQKMLPKITQEMLAEMIGATRSRVNSFMNIINSGNWASLSIMAGCMSTLPC
jgi:Crp-like helix-turn-helix domain